MLWGDAWRPPNPFAAPRWGRRGPPVRSELSAAGEGIHEHLAVRLFERCPDRQPAGEAGEFDGHSLETLGDHQRRGIPLDVRRGAEDHLAKLTLSHPGGEGVEREAVGSLPLQRRDPSLQHVVQPR